MGFKGVSSLAQGMLAGTEYRLRIHARRACFFQLDLKIARHRKVSQGIAQTSQGIARHRKVSHKHHLRVI